MSRPDLIWWDSESNLGRGWKSEYASEEQNLEENKMPLPCEGCDQADYCLTNSTDCQAFVSGRTRVTTVCLPKMATSLVSTAKA